MSLKRIVALLFFLSCCSLAALAQSVITFQPDSVCGKDAFVHGLSWERNENFGSNGEFAAVSWTFQGEPGNVRALVQFNLDFLPSDAVVTSAYLSLYAWPYTNGFGQHSSFSQSDIGWLRRITSDWDENTVTWSNQPSFTTQNQVVVPESTSPTEDYINMDVKPLVLDMLSDPQHSFGFLLMEQIDQYYCRLNFCSSDFPDAAKHPKLVINYTSASYPANSTIVTGGQCSPAHDPDIWTSGGTASSSVLTLPNTFTPNGDGTNDVFAPIQQSNIQLTQFIVLNRWGSVVFKSSDQIISWDGNSNGKPVSDGVYFWIAEYINDLGKTVRLQGNISIFSQ